MAGVITLSWIVFPTRTRRAQKKLSYADPEKETKLAANVDAGRGGVNARHSLESAGQIQGLGCRLRGSGTPSGAHTVATEVEHLSGWAPETPPSR